jgi:predicted porin
MKTVLLSTTALALAGAMAAPASAAEWNVRVGGYMEQYIGYADVDANFSGDYDGIDSKMDPEVWFLPSITLDNGIKFAANIQLEGLTDSDQIDESMMIITGSFGEVILGSENSAGFLMTYVAPDVTFINLNSGSTTMFIPWSGNGAGDDLFRGTLNTTFIENSRNNDAQRFTYFSPRFAGFQVGVSYARDGLQDNNSQVDVNVENGGFPTDIFDFGANYVQSFGDFDVAVSGRWGTGNDHSGDDATIWSTGLNLGFGGFTVGGSYAEQNNNGHRFRNGEAYDLGVSYETGPWGVSFTYQHGENQGNPDPDGTLERGDEESDQYLVGLSYDLAKGVNVGAYGVYVDFDDAKGGSANHSVDGFIIGTGFKIKF